MANRLQVGDKSKMIADTRIIAKQCGGKCRVESEGNKRRIRLVSSDGRYSCVWFPEQSRVDDLEIKDLVDAVEYIFG